LGSIYNHAQGINNAGQIVGDFVDSGGNYRGFVLTNGSYITLNNPSATVMNGQSITLATGINNTGQIVGSYRDGTGTGNHGFLFSNGTYTTLDRPGATGATTPLGINDAGQIVGWFQDGTGNHGFLYSNGNYTTINDPASAPGLTMAWGINNAGEIVGYYGDNGTDPSGAHGFLATPTPPSAVPLHPSIITQLTGLGLLGWLARRIQTRSWDRLTCRHTA
jgi:probable HAF family extracellular repeat protein